MSDVVVFVRGSLGPSLGCLATNAAEDAADAEEDKSEDAEDNPDHDGGDVALSFRAALHVHGALVRAHRDGHHSIIAVFIDSPSCSGVGDRVAVLVIVVAVVAVVASLSLRG